MTATYQEPPATVREHVTKAVIRSMYGIGECWLQGTDSDCVSTICAVVRTRYTCRLQKVSHGMLHFCIRKMRSWKGHSNDQEPCVKYLQPLEPFLPLVENLQHAKRLIPSQFVLNIHCRLRLYDETDQAQPEKERRVCVFPLRSQLRLRIWTSTPHRRPPREHRRSLCRIWVLRGSVQTPGLSARGHKSREGNDICEYLWLIDWEFYPVDFVDSVAYFALDWVGEV